MFESLYSNKVNNKELIKILERHMEKYHTTITLKSNGDVEIFVGSERKPIEEQLKEGEHNE